MANQLLDLKICRRRRLSTVRALALAAGVTASTVVRVESGQQTPQLGTIRALSAALEVEPEQVLEFRHAMGLPEVVITAEVQRRTEQGPESSVRADLDLARRRYAKLEAEQQQLLRHFRTSGAEFP